MSFLLDGLLVATGWVHVLLAPYSKVEESFNLHAIHDVLMYGVNTAALSQYDHFVFPGAVPRTFIGSCVLAWVSLPIISSAASLGFVQSKFTLQIVIRLVLSTCNALGLCAIRRATARRFGRLAGLFFVLLTCSQFHLPFWMGRTVPNSFALFLANISTYSLLNCASASKGLSSRSSTVAVSALAFAAIVFRAELALLLGPLALQLLYLRALSFRKLVLAGLLASLISVAATVLVDSYFWDQPLLWPEFSAIYFNVFQGKSAEWGVSPPLTYFTSFLPKLLLSSLPLSLVAIAFDPRIAKLLLPSLGFISLISFLGHKEWRFIIYVVPVFNIAAARTCKSMVSLPKNSWKGRILFAVVFGCILGNFAFTSFTTFVSVLNYPGGEALRRLHAPDISEPVHVHISNLAAQTGASLFLQLNAPPYWNTSVTTPWVYNKTEGLEFDALLAPRSPFTHLIVETEPPPQLLAGKSWKVIDAIEAFDGIRLNLPSQKIFHQSDIPLAQRLFNVLSSLIQIRKREKLWILEKVL